MSNRVRIFLLVPGSKYNEPFVGSKALKKLEAMYLDMSSQKTVIFEMDKFGNPVAIYKDPEPTQTPPAMSRWKLAQWLWEKLPPQFRAACTFIVTREPRSFDYRDSITNPKKFGYASAKKKVLGTSFTNYKAVLEAADTPSHWAFDDSPGFDSFSSGLQAASKRVKAKKTEIAPEPVATKSSLRVGIWS